MVSWLIFTSPLVSLHTTGMTHLRITCCCINIEMNVFQTGIILSEWVQELPLFNPDAAGVSLSSKEMLELKYYKVLWRGVVIRWVKCCGHLEHFVTWQVVCHWHADFICTWCIIIVTAVIRCRGGCVMLHWRCFPHHWQILVVEDPLKGAWTLISIFRAILSVLT